MSDSFLVRSHQTAFGVGCLLLSFWGVGITQGVDLQGAHLFTANCVRCHGEAGSGTEDYPDPLRGDLSVAQLAELIRLTMPEDDPETLSVEEARSIAEYAHREFYSPVAQSRNKLPEIDLARLTVKQHRRVLADLVGGFAKAVQWQGGEGLKGEYYLGRQGSETKPRGELALTRVDQTVEFDFTGSPPVEGGKDKGHYSVLWSGSIYAAATGWYRFDVRTERSARLWVNDNSDPIIDAWIQSGEGSNSEAKVFLIGGRSYPVRVQFSVSNQGVQDKKFDREEFLTKAASIRLLWEPPHGTLQTIPKRFLSPQAVPESFVCTTPFPPDDRSYGWERGTTISQAWEEATTGAAIEAANYLDAHLAQLTKRGNVSTRETLEGFATKLAESAFRQPLTPELKQKYVTQHFQEIDDPQLALRRAELMILMSPRFLYREVDAEPSAYDVASRLAFTLWDSQPDKKLLAAADKGKLATEEQVRKQAVRMLGDMRARSKLQDFLLTWLDVDSQVDLTKNPERFPEFDAETIADLRTSLEVFLDEVVWSEESDYRRLFLADEVFLNKRLARFYGESELNDSEEFSKSKIDGGRRAGVLTHPYVLARFAHPEDTSPILRGVFLVRRVLGQALKPPPEAVPPLAARLHPELTTRERVTLQTKPASCMTCHHLINPLGFTLERFDAVGRYRDHEDDKVIDDVGVYQAREGEAVTLAGARDLAEFLASSEEVHEAFVEQLFHYLVQQSIQAYGPEMQQRLTRSFVKQDYNIQKLVIEIAVASSMRGRDDAEIERISADRD
ncbi:DUF1592 domain-containing protein [Bythopirellula goksoeyrii]|uniref:PA14 domain protein n=1 Tax=Bythopirellula goksoeyrii TaxID=1400387 RepID=A0A5B9QKC7_9BACT|nr:DUF1592 domain-containing protein [Bythopirellula goksoeyrii]QEG37985.1 PA14 domain protein [Bythopirellula goksoeyrii]